MPEPMPPVAAPLVLLVEDDAAVRSTLAAILDDEGCDSIIASNGLDALVALEQHEPHVIVLDWMMPIVDGQTFLQALRTAYTRPPPVLVISAGGITEEQSRRFGVDAYLPKPFDIDELMRIVWYLVGRAKRET